MVNCFSFFWGICTILASLVFWAACDSVFCLMVSRIGAVFSSIFGMMIQTWLIFLGWVEIINHSKVVSVAVGVETCSSGILRLWIMQWQSITCGVTVVSVQMHMVGDIICTYYPSHTNWYKQINSTLIIIKLHKIIHHIMLSLSLSLPIYHICIYTALSLYLYLPSWPGKPNSRTWSQALECPLPLVIKHCWKRLHL